MRRRTSLRSHRTIESLEPRLLLASTLYVDVNSPGPNRDGTSWDAAYLNPQDALAVAVSGDTIRVADGTYKPTSGTDRTISFNLKTGVSLLGGYAGYRAADPDARDISANPTILSGDIGATSVDTDNSYHVVSGGDVNATTVIEGFSITAGRALKDISTWNQGGGMHIAAGSPKIRQCTFIENAAYSSGGGLFISSGAPSISGCSFIRNAATYSYGGGVYNGTGSPVVTNCMFGGNSANTGGGMYNSSASTVINCSFSGNCAGTYGGAVANGQGNQTQKLVNCTIVCNTSWYLCGGVYNYAGAPISNCIIWGNAAPGDAQLVRIVGVGAVSYSDIQGGYTGTGNINVDPLLPTPDRVPLPSWTWARTRQLPC
jgi:hypothetical protein